MIKYTDECVSCGLPCLGDSCPNRNVKHLICDRCGEEIDEAWIVDGEHLCEDWLKDEFEHIDYEDI